MLETSKPMKKVAEELIQHLKERESTETILAETEINQRAKRAALVDLMLGPRYSQCRFTNFNYENSKQEKELNRVKLFAEGFDQHVKVGSGLFIYGPSGTGKDHLASAALRMAHIVHGCEVEIVNGLDLYGDARDLIDHAQSERSFVQKWFNAQVLLISDPTPPKGEASQYGLGMLFRILDKRYRHLRSTWVTMNVANREDADNHLTRPVVDRLIDNSLTVFCNWKSYRKALDK
jgi:DNA replication protein DnaC